jgi:hypothetical protein
MKLSLVTMAALASMIGGAANASAEDAGEAVEHRFLEPKPGKPVTFYTPDGELTLYGNLDVSADATTKGISTLRDENGNGPPGRVGWMPALSTNLSYVGLRGFQKLVGLQFVYQLETQIDIAASPGLSESSSNKSDVVKGAFTSRNSYIGLASRLGAIKVGKTDAPYKNSTSRMNPFSGMIGDYAVVMGNTGGDNRVEFGTRLSHAIWYESPSVQGITLAALYSPGQNRAWDSSDLPAGEPDCAGGNIPGSGGTGAAPFPISCNDGSFSDAFSASVSGEWGPVYVTGAYERHEKVNRNSDIYGIVGAYPLTGPFVGWDEADVATEDAWKVGAQLKLTTGSTLSGIFEDFHRYLPSYLQFQNERQRTGWWLSLTQMLGQDDSISVGWAHANKSPGDPGQHNTSINDVGNGLTAGGSGADNSANMFTAALKHSMGHDVTLYAAAAETINAKYAHYDLGAGGRAVTTDCHDGGLPASGDTASNPHCWAGGKLIGFSLGVNKRF